VIKAKVGTGGDLVKIHDDSVTAGDTKKSRANRPAQDTVLVGAGASSKTDATRRVGTPQPSASKAEVDKRKIDTSHASKKMTGKSRTKEPSAGTSTRVATAQPTAHSSEDDSVTEILGPALVAGALCRKIGDAHTSEMMKGITECRVEILTTRQKAKRPLPNAPNNSAESNSVVEGASAYKARLFLSATDQHLV